MALSGLILINVVARQMASLSGKGLPVRVVAEFFLLSLPSNLALTVPMAVLVAVLHTFSQMASDHEIAALKASGIDLKRLVLPLLLAAALIAGGMVWFNDRVLPEANHRWQTLMIDVARTTPLLALNEQAVTPIQTADGAGRYYLQADRIDRPSSRMWNVAIYDVSSPGVGRTIYADSGVIAFDRGETDLVLTLFDGEVREVKLHEPQSFQQVAFRRQVMRMAGVQQGLDRTEGASYRTDRDMPIAMMRARIDSLRAELRAGAGAVRSGMVETEIRQLRVEVAKKYAIAAASVVFVLIGVPLALRFPGGGIGMVIVASLAIFALYYAGFSGGETLANRGYVPPVAAMWVMNALLGTLGVLGMSRLGRELGTGRTGAWERVAAALGAARPSRRGGRRNA